MGNPRLSPATPASELFSLATHVLSLPEPSFTDDSTAHIAITGEGEDWRIDHAVDYFRMTSGWLLVAPFNTRETTTKRFTLEELQARYGLLPGDLKVVIIGGHAEHTPAQAGWFYRLHREHRFSSALIYASPYHVVRAYLTFLKYLLEQDCKLPLFARPTPVPPDTVVPESGLTSWDSIHGEAERIEKYQKAGRVATLDELREYLAWLWKQPMVRKY